MLTFKPVLLISVDGFHALDLSNYIATDGKSMGITFGTSFALSLWERGVSLQEVSILLGHRYVTMRRGCSRGRSRSKNRLKRRGLSAVLSALKPSRAMQRMVRYPLARRIVAFLLFALPAKPFARNRASIPAFGADRPHRAVMDGLQGCATAGAFGLRLWREPEHSGNCSANVRG
jgi:hypothetical protein